MARLGLADGLPGLDDPPLRVEVEARLDVGVAAEEDELPDRRAIVPLLAVDVARRVGEVDDLANFEEIQRGLACQEDEWIYMHRGLGIPGRVRTDEHGIVTAPATDEAFMREYIKEWKRLMQARPTLVVERAP